MKTLSTARDILHFEDRPCVITSPQSVLQTLLDHKIDIDHSCGGFATCGTCRVIVEKDVQNLPPRNDVEASFAEDRDFLPEERLACQLPCRPGLVVSRPYFLRTKKGFE